MHNGSGIMREEKIGLPFCLLLSNQSFKQKIKWVDVMLRVAMVMGLMLRVAMVTDTNVLQSTLQSDMHCS